MVGMFVFGGGVSTELRRSGRLHGTRRVLVAGHFTGPTITAVIGTLGPMATEKRERQRANRERKQAALKKQKRRRDAVQLIKRWALIGLAIILTLVAANLLFGN